MRLFAGATAAALVAFASLVVLVRIAADEERRSQLETIVSLTAAGALLGSSALLVALLLWLRLQRRRAMRAETQPSKT